MSWVNRRRHPCRPTVSAIQWRQTQLRVDAVDGLRVQAQPLRELLHVMTFGGRIEVDGHQRHGIRLLGHIRGQVGEEIEIQRLGHFFTDKRRFFRADIAELGDDPPLFLSIDLAIGLGGIDHGFDKG